MDIEPFEIDKETLDEIIQIEFYLKNCQDLTAVANEIESDIINKKYRIFPILPIIAEKGSFNEIYRVSVNKDIRDDKLNKRLDLISQLKYPPPEKEKYLNYNRCSYKGQSIFYGGFGKLFSLIETQPTKDTLITLSKWKIKNGKQLNYIPIFQNEKIHEYSDVCHKQWNEYKNKLDKLNNMQRLAIEKIYSLITYFFTRPVKSKGEYLFSAYFSNLYFNQNISETDSIEAMFYPSVPTKWLAWNLAIKTDVFEEKFDFVKAEEFNVETDKKTAGGWGMEKLAESIEHIDGKLVWREI